MLHLKLLRVVAGLLEKNKRAPIKAPLLCPPAKHLHHLCFLAS